MLNDYTQNELFLLFSEYSEEQLSEKQFKELDELLQKSPKARALYVKYRATEAKMEDWFGWSEEVDAGNVTEAACDLHGIDLSRTVEPFAKGDFLLGSAALGGSFEEVPWGGNLNLDHTLDTTVMDVTTDSLGTTVAGIFRGSVTLWSTISFSIVIVAAMLFATLTLNDSDHLGEVTQTVNAVWEGSVNDSDLESLSMGSQLNLKSGLAQLTYENGVCVNLEGPVTYELSGPNQGTLLAGKMSALVNDASIGFTVQTPAGSVIDLGTEFGIDVARNQDTKVQVFDGRVKFALRPTGKATPKKRTFELIENDSVFVDSRRWSIKRAPYTPEQFTRNYSELGLYYRDDFSTDTSNEYVSNYSLWGTREGFHEVDGGLLILHAEATTYMLLSRRCLLEVGELFAIDVPPVKPGLSVFSFVSTVGIRPQGGVTGAGGFRLRRDEGKGLVVQQCDFERIPRSGKAWLLIEASRIDDPAPNKALRLIIQRTGTTEFVFYYELDGVRTKIWGPVDYPSLAKVDRFYVGMGTTARGTQKQTATFDNFTVRSAQE